MSIATKVGKNAFYLSKQKALISAKQVFSNTPSDGSAEGLFYHLPIANAVLLSMSFPLPSVCFSKRPQIHVGSFLGFVLSPSKCKRFATLHIFSIADVCDCRGIGFVRFLGLNLFYLLTQTLPQALIVVPYRQSACGLYAGLTCN